MTAPSSTKRHRILIVDDNAAIHEDFRKILSDTRTANAALQAAEATLFGTSKPAARGQSFEVDYASQGEEALALVRRGLAENRPYSLAFIDGRMPPGWDGIETISHIWREYPDLQVVFCTAYSDYSWEAIRQVLGDTDSMVILKKPFDNVEVLQLAHTLVRKWELNCQVKARLDALDEAVRERTAQREEAVALFEGAFAQSPTGILIADVPDVKIRWANAAALTVCGQPNTPQSGTETVREALPCQMFRPDGSPFPFAELPLSRAVLKGEVTQDQEMIIRRPAGGERWVSVNAAPVRHPQGHITAGILVFQDITERRRAEASLRESEERLRLAITSANQGLYDLDVQTGVAMVSPEYARMLGYDPATFHETNAAWIERLHPDDRERVVGLHYDYLAGRLPNYQVEYRQRTVAGEWKWFLSVGKVVQRDAGGRPLRMLGTHTDITSRKQAEEEKERLQSQLMQAQKMESVGRLAGGVAHDFNNMLQAILGNTFVALLDLPADSPAREHLEEIQQAARRSADLTRQLLAFARKQTIVPRALDLNDTVVAMFKMLQRLIGEDIQLVWKPGKSLWQVKLDPSQIDQVLANLIVNARDAIGDTGTVTIETANARFDEASAATQPDARPGDYVMLAISDTGCGMVSTTLEHLFEPFFTTKEVGKGTGLGLATVFGIVKQNRGWINVRSSPGAGSTFKIFLPATAPVAQGERMATALRERHGTETILLVEDESQVLGLAARVLRRLGYTVLPAASPAAAIKLCDERTETIHLLLTDVVMPEMNGRELRDRLAESRPGLRCLFLSGYPADVIAQHGVLNAGVHFLQKPFSVEALAEKIREVLAA